MGKKTILLPNPTSYLNYVNKVLIDSYTVDVPTDTKAIPTTEVARILVNEDGFFYFEETAESL